MKRVSIPVNLDWIKLAVVGDYDEAENGNPATFVAELIYVEEHANIIELVDEEMLGRIEDQVVRMLGEAK